MPSRCKGGGCGETLAAGLRLAGKGVRMGVVPVPCRGCDGLAEGDQRRGGLCAGCWHDMLAVAGRAGFPVETPLGRRFLLKVDMGGPVPPQDLSLGPCWLWLGGRNDDGYPVFRTGSQTPYAHIVAFEWAYGLDLLPPGWVHDHMCHDPLVCGLGAECPHRRCVNPRHIVPAPYRTNSVLRSSSPTALNARVTHCGVCGWPLAGRNLVTRADRPGERGCRNCRRVAARQYEVKRRALGVRHEAGAGQLSLPLD